jgi:hypothetical protein
MAWLLLTSDHIATALTGPELAAAQSAALASGQSAPLDDILAQVSRYVRARIAACSRNALGEGDTIPDELLSAAIDIAVYRLAKRLPGKVLARQERIDAAAAAESLLQDVAACKLSLAQPLTATTEVVSAPASPTFSGRTRRFTRSTQDGA